MRSALVLAPLFLLLTFSCKGPEGGQNGPQPASQPAPVSILVSDHYYPNELCLVSGKPANRKGTEQVFEVEGRTVKTCCTNCKAAVLKSPKKYLAKLDKWTIEEQRRHYPLSTCVISGEKLDAMGEPVDVLVDQTLIRVCCDGCKDEIEENPQKVVAKLRMAVAKKALAAGATCPVSGEKIPAGSKKAVVLFIGNKAVPLCCKGCADKVEANPGKYLGK